MGKGNNIYGDAYLVHALLFDHIEHSQHLDKFGLFETFTAPK